MCNICTNCEVCSIWTGKVHKLITVRYVIYGQVKYNTNNEL